MARSVRRRRLIYTALLSTVTSVSAQDSNTLDCSNPISIEGVSYNISSLDAEKSLERNRTTPPSTMVDGLRFNICRDLTHIDGVADRDQCSAGTRACLAKTNKKSGSDDRIISVIPVAQTSKLAPAYSALQSPAGLSILLHAGSYPPNSDSPVPQSFNVTLLCTQDGNSDPTFESYENGTVVVQWRTGAGCSSTGDNGSSGGGSGNKDKHEADGHSSGIGWFFSLLFFAFVGYFVLGAYHNYNNYGATGWDLVPHRDFWRDVPFLLRDFTEHLCSTLRPGHSGASRRGYMAV